MTRRPKDIATRFFVGILALGGWLLLVAPSLWDFGPTAVATPSWLAVGMFLTVIVVSRMMASHLQRGVVVSLDAGFYLAACVCLGSLVSGRIVAFALLFDGLFRGFWTVRRHSRFSINLAYSVYFGGMSGGLVFLVGWIGGLDALYVLTGKSDGVVLLRVFLAGGIFLMSHYGIQGIRMMLAGELARVIVRGVAVPAILAELAVLPLAAIAVFLYHPEEPLKFALLGVMYLVVNTVFQRLSATRAQLRQRVHDLETLSETSRRLTASLELRELVVVLSEEVVKAMPEAQQVVLVHRVGMDVEAESLVVDRYDRETNTFSRSFANPDDPVMGRVVTQEGRTTYISDLDKCEATNALTGVRSWLGVPIEIYGSVEGALAVQSSKAYAFDQQTMRLLQAIGRQAAIALQNVRLYELAMVDGLTKLYVRRYFDARLVEEFERTLRFQTQFSVVMMDLDNFKALNDRYGHVVGDRALREVAEVVSSQMRGVDTAARFGGEEIGVVLPRTSLLEARNLAERIRKVVEGLRIDDGQGGTLQLTVSMGIASHPEGGAASPEDLIALADKALYRAKEHGRNRVELYGEMKGIAPQLRRTP